MANEPGDEAGIVPCHAMFKAKGFCIAGAEFGMIAAATLGNVMKQSGQISDFGFLQRLHDVRAEREFVIESRKRKTAKIADDEQGMCIDRVTCETGRTAFGRQYVRKPEYNDPVRRRYSCAVIHA